MIKKTPTRRTDTQKLQKPGERGERTTRNIPAGPPEASKTPLIIGGVGGALVLLLLVVMMSGSSKTSSHSTADQDLSKAIKEVYRLQAAGRPREALDMCERTLGDDRLKKRSRINEVRNLQQQLNLAVNGDRIAAEKTADLVRRVNAAKEDGTAMKKSKEFMQECQTLLASNQLTPSAAQLQGLREDLRRWVNTESQSDWQRDYNAVRDRVLKQFLGSGQFAEAVREWRRFGETSPDPLLKSRIDSELSSIDQAATTAAEGIISGAGTGAGARQSLEEALTRFLGTQGATLIQKHLKGLK